MSEASIRAAIKTEMNTVTGIGIVHDYQRWAANLKDFLDLMLFTAGTSKKIFGWMITRTSAEVMRIGNNFRVTHNYKLIGLYGLKDAAASEKLLNLVIESLVSKLVNLEISGAQNPIGLPKVGLIGHKSFGGVLCHWVEITFSVSEPLAAETQSYDDLLRIYIDYDLLDPEELDTAAQDIIDTAV